MEAVCTPPHDIPGNPVASYLPKGQGSEILKDLMRRSEAVLRKSSGQPGPRSPR